MLWDCPLCLQLKRAPTDTIGDVELPTPYASAACTADGRIWVALNNMDPPGPPHRVNLSFSGLVANGATRRILTGPTMDAHNSFDQPDLLRPAPFRAVAMDGELVVELPA